MRNVTLPLLALLFSFSKINAQENQIQVNSKISNVTVFISGAQVQRQAETVDIPPGVSQFVFSGLSSAIETQSIQARGEGNFTILSVTQQTNFLFEKKNSELKANYLKIVSDLTDQISSLRNENEVYRAEQEMLSKNQTVTGPNVNFDLAKLKQALDFQKQRLIEAKNKQLEINKSILKLQNELNKYNRQLAELDGKASHHTNDIVVKISSKAATKGKLSITYMVNNAGWYPTYDIRAKDVVSPIELIYKANVTQNSGEDWKNIKLTLSSGNPSTNGTKPNLAPYNLGYLSLGYGFDNILSSNVRVVKGRVISKGDNLPIPGVSIRIENSSIGTTTDESGNYSIQIPAGQQVLTYSFLGYVAQELPVVSTLMNITLEEDAKSLNEVVVVGGRNPMTGSVSGVQVSKQKKETKPVEVQSYEKQTNIVFEIKDPYTILSGGKQFSVEIGEYAFNAEYEYFSAPKVTEEAFLTAKITNFADANLISGEANIFFEGTYLGKSLLDVQNSSDSITISLGVDKNVVVKREKQKDFNERQFIGSAQKDSRSFVIDIKNRKNQAINLVIEDQLPISTSSDISVERQEISKAKYDETFGKLTWQLKLAPNEQQKLFIKYQVKYPKNRPINLE